MTNSFFPWKGKTFNQISSAIQLNVNNAKTLTPNQLLSALPLKIYRREIAIYGSNTGFLNDRSVKIDNINMPGSTIVSTSGKNPIGICSTLNIDYPNNKTEFPSASPITDNACNARKRVRSAGMIKRVYDPKYNTPYCTNTNQYLVSRNLAYSSNEYAFLRIGNPSLIPGPNAAPTNIYSTAGLNKCTTVKINFNNNTYSYYWVDNLSYNITIPTGDYNFETFVNAFNTQLFVNKTYLINGLNLRPIQLLTIGYDNINNIILLQSGNITQLAGNYSNYLDASTQLPIGSNSTTLKGKYTLYMPYFIIPSTGIQNVIGFPAGTYNQPASLTSTTHLTIQSKSTIGHSLMPNYSAVNYKPSNSKFAQQGAVSASARLLRKKYDTITSNANTLRNSFGNGAANAMAYGISEDPITLKAQLGYPNTKYPYVKNGNIVCLSEKSNCQASMRVS
jgi:hypothetical protein